MLNSTLAKPSIIVAFLLCTFWMNLLHADDHGFFAASHNTSSSLTAYPLSLLSDSLYCRSAVSENVPLAVSNPDATTISSILNFDYGGLITDVNISGLSIAHTRVGNLTVTLTSPQGTTVTLLDQPGNGACLGDNLLLSFDDAAAATAAELQATCNTAVPAISGDFQPSQLLAAFEGENPLGDWILAVTDNVAGSGGALINWGIEICTAPCNVAIDSIVTTATGQCGAEYGTISVFTSAALDHLVIYTINGPVQQSNDTGIFTDVPVGTYNVQIKLPGLIYCSLDTTIFLGSPAYAPADLPIAISDGVANTIVSVLHVPQARLISSVRVTNIDVTHTFAGDLQFGLISPSGTHVLLNSRDEYEGFWCPEDNVFLTFDDQATLDMYDFEHTCNEDTTARLGTFKPYERLSKLFGENMLGDWKLVVYDQIYQDGGSLNNWNLEICSLPCDVVIDNVAVHPESCPGAADGSITVSATGAILPITYTISGPVTHSNPTGIFVNLPVGGYLISVTPNNPTCTMTDSVTITSLPVSPTGFPTGWSNYNIGNAGGSAVYTGCASTSEFVLTSKRASGTFDIQHSLLRSLCGDGNIIAQVTGITNAGWAGIEIRENTSTSSRKVLLKTQLGNAVRRMARTQPGTPLQSLQFTTQPGPIWLQIIRVGNNFTFFVSEEDGATWQQVGNAITLALSDCVQAGIFVEGLNGTITTTGVFKNLSVTPGDVTPLAGMPNSVVAAADSPIPELQLYPNPTTGQVTLDLEAYGSRTVELSWYDAQNGLLHRVEVDAAATPMQQLDFSGYPNGIYLVRAKAEGLPDAVKRVVVQGNE